MSSIFKLCNVKSKCIPKNPLPDGKPKQRLHYLWIIPPLSFALAIFTLSYIAFFALPEPEYSLETKSENSHNFIERNALAKLKNLSNIGPRLVGNKKIQEETIKFFKHSIHEIKSKALEKYDIADDVQISSGSFVKDGMVSVYTDITNYVVKFSTPCCNSSSALLLNSHFDTIPGSEGTGDDATMVVIMLEVLRVLSTTSKTLKHPVIFLFNGAKENSLQGSHAFITQHEWAKDVKAFINLDSMGLGGREILLRLEPGHSWLMKHYSKSVHHPYASSIVEELHEHNFFMFKTDFEIFRDYGNIPGIDMAHMYNGFVHHTKYDNYSSIWGFGFLQHTGDNVLALVRSIASSDELVDSNQHSGDRVIFFDFLGLFFIYYSEVVGLAINISCAIISLTAMSISIWSMCKTMDESLMFLIREFSVALLIQATSLMLASAIPLVLALIIDAAGASMFWFSQEWLIFGIYFCPFCFTVTFIPALYLTWRQKTFPLRFGVQLFLHSYCLILIIFTVISTSLSIRSTFIVVVNITFYTLSVIINWAAKLQAQPFIWLIPILLCQIIPLIFHCYSSLILFMTLIPTTGWSGIESNPDITIAGFTVAFAFLMCGFWAPLFSICRKPKTTTSIFMIVFLIFVIIMATPLGFPFRKATSPQRIWIFDTKIMYNYQAPANIAIRGHDAFTIEDRSEEVNYYDEKGFVVVPLDRYSPTSLEEIFSETPKYTLQTRKNFTNLLMHGLPLYSSALYSAIINHHYWINAPMVNLPDEHRVYLSVKDWEEIGINRFRYTFEVRGPSHIQILIRANVLSEFFNVTLYEPIPKESYFLDRTYFIQIIQGTLESPTPLVIELERFQNFMEHAFEIATIGHHNSKIKQHDSEFTRLLDFLPDWVAVTPIVSTYERYIYY